MDYSRLSTIAECDEEIALSQNNAGNIWNSELAEQNRQHINAVWNRKAEIANWGLRIL